MSGVRAAEPKGFGPPAQPGGGSVRRLPGVESEPSTLTSSHSPVMIGLAGPDDKQIFN